MSSPDGDRSGATWSSKTNAEFHVPLAALNTHSSQCCRAKRGVFSEQDIEKGSLHNNEHFDLRDYLTSSIEANQGAGIQHKHVGVTWENLQVVAPGGEDDKVR
jgi:ATP-binding cassette, subfamily G (WHITE), member 2, SNQ2